MLLAVGIIISVGATVYGMIELFKAQDLAWDSMDKWLNSCYFRFVEVPGKTFIPNLIPFHDEVKNNNKNTNESIYKYYYEKERLNSPSLKSKNKEKEITSFFKVLSTPKLKVDWSRKEVGNRTLYLGSRTVHMYVKDKKDAKIKIEVNFPFSIDKKSFTYAISTSNKQEVLHKVGEISNYLWTTESLGKKKFELDIRHVSNALIEMFLTFSFKVATHGNEREVLFVYKIYCDESYKLLEN